MTEMSKTADEPRFPDFPRTEFEERYRRARQKMRDEKLDALFITDPTNYTYFSGHRSDQLGTQKIRPFVFLLPLEGEPVCFVMGFENKAISSTTFVRSVRNYDLFKHNPVFVDVIKERGLEGANIGFELGREQYLSLSYNDFNELKGLLPKARFSDASRLILDMRAVKSPSEIERIEKICGMTARGIGEVFARLKPGMMTSEIGRDIRIAILNQGADNVPSVKVTAGYDFAKGKAYTVDVPLETGFTVTADVNGVLDGYWSDVTRTVVLGKATQEQRDMYRFVFDLTRTCYDAIKPGVACKDVIAVCKRELERAGRSTQAVGRIGHGIGCDGLEYPSLAASEEIVIEEGMTFACNPNFTTGFGFFNVEENLAVTRNGFRYLSEPTAAKDLQVIG